MPEKWLYFYDTHFQQKEKVKNICIYVNSSMVLCYSSTVGTQDL